MDRSTSTNLLLGLCDPGNSLAWTSFCSRYEPVLIAFGRRLGLREHDAQDAAQETLLAFATGYQNGQYQKEKGRLRSWLYGIAANKIHEIRRRHRRERLLADQSDATGFLERIPDAASMSEIWEAEWKRAVLQVCIEQVRRDVKLTSLRVLELCVFEKRPVEQVAQTLGMSVEAVLKARTRVLSRMRAVRRQLEADW